MTNPIESIQHTDLDTVSGGFCGTPAWARHQRFHGRDVAAWRRFEAYRGFRAGYYPSRRAQFARGWR